MSPHRPSCTCLSAAIVLLAIGPPALAQAATEQFQTPRQLVEAMLQHEDAPHTDRYEYMLDERSDRTGGHLWTERVVELATGRVLFLLAVDGQPLSPAATAEERTRLATLAADPTGFARTAAAEHADEQRDRQMLDLLPKAFLLDNVRLDNGTWRIDFHPDPAYAPSGLEERVLHGMSGTVSIDAHDLRLVQIQAHLPQDVSIGFGFLATIKAGSHFESDRQKIDGHWRTVHVLTDIRGRAGLFKAVARQSDLTRSGFHYLPGDITTPQAVALVEQ